MKKLMAGLCALALAAAGAVSNAAELRPDHPDSYVVKKGDTLWDISGHFLAKPWLWPEIWEVNPQVKNPHLIYPGDLLSLIYVDGKPRLVKGRRSGDMRLSPDARVLSQGDAVTALPLEAVAPFLVGARVVSEEQMRTAPYVLAADDERLASGEGDRIYLRGIKDNSLSNMAFFRKGDAYIDPDTQELLGIEAIHLGAGNIKRAGDPATVMVTKSVQEILKGDRALPADEQQMRPVFLPHAVPKGFSGRIISVYDGVSQIGQYDVVVINRGERENVEVGHVMTVYRKGAVVSDKFAKEARETGEQGMGERLGNFLGGERGEEVTLPDEEAGQIMVFRTFEKVSLALVMEAERPMHVLDVVRTPE